MKADIIVSYNKGIVVNGEREIFFKEHLLHIILTPFIAVILLFEAYKTGANSSIYFLAISVIMLCVFCLIYLYYFKPHKTAGLWGEAGLKTAIFRFSDKEIILEATGIKSNIEWSEIKKFWFTKDFLVLRTKQGWYTSIPISEFSKQLISDIRSKLESS